jgi:NADH:ubiquinone oxidoreductase subunit E
VSCATALPFKLTICTNLPCALKGASVAAEHLKSALGVGFNETTADGLFTLKEVECLGACVNAPIVQFNDDYVEDLTSEKFLSIIEDLKQKYRSQQKVQSFNRI